MDNKTIEQCFLNVKVIHAFKDSGQKVVFLIDHPMHKISILKIVKEMNERITREIDIATKYNIKNIPRIFMGKNMRI